MIFAIFDMKMGAYLQPMFFRSEGEALRAWQDIVNDSNPNNGIAKYPEDYSFYHLGNWNDESGEFTILDKPKSYGSAVGYKTVSQENPMPLQGGQRGKFKRTDNKARVSAN